MERTTIMLPHDLKAKAAKHANSVGISLGQYIREAIANSLETQQNDPRADDPLFSDDTVFSGKTRTDLAKKHDEYLYGESS